MAITHLVMISHEESSHESVFRSSPSSIIVAIVSGGFALSIVLLVSVHTYLISRGLTTNEHIRYGIEQSAYDAGVFRNCLAALCGPQPPSRIYASLPLDDEHPLYGEYGVKGEAAWDGECIRRTDLALNAPPAPATQASLATTSVNLPPSHPTNFTPLGQGGSNIFAETRLSTSSLRPLEHNGSQGTLDDGSRAGRGAVVGSHFSLVERFGAPTADTPPQPRESVSGARDGSGIDGDDQVVDVDTATRSNNSSIDESTGDIVITAV